MVRFHSSAVVCSKRNDSRGIIECLKVISPFSTIFETKIHIMFEYTKQASGDVIDKILENHLSLIRPH